MSFTGDSTGISSAERIPLSQTLDRGLTVLETIAASAAPVSLAVLAAELGLPKSVVHRLVATLCDHHLVTSTRDGYALGPGAQLLGRRTLPMLQRIARPEVGRLASAVGLTAFFEVRDADRGIILVSVEMRSAHSNAVYEVGDEHLLTRGAPGLAILSCDPPTADERPEVARARAQGYCVTRGEVVPGQTVLAAPVTAADGRAVGAVAVAFRDEPVRPAHLREVLASARTLTERARAAQAAGTVLPGGGAAPR
ncbi:helix-turn-helix domain-containing protein [Streptomyces sp. NPDC047061]|uniref:IclR family transcriptional regulator n=1 Tax=Streptomyces sp. NPDC047061 TaxID=3154605 RepID=UPI0033C562A4